VKPRGNRKVVVKAVVDDRADRDLRLREELFHRVGQQVCRRVPQNLEPVGVALGDDGNVGVALDHVRYVDQLAVDTAGQGSLGEPRPIDAANRPPRAPVLRRHAAIHPAVELKSSESPLEKKVRASRTFLSQGALVPRRINRP